MLVHLSKQHEQLLTVIVDHIHLDAHFGAIDIMVLKFVEHGAAEKLEDKAARSVNTTVNGEPPESHENKKPEVIRCALKYLGLNLQYL